MEDTSSDILNSAATDGEEPLCMVAMVVIVVLSLLHQDLTFIFRTRNKQTYNLLFANILQKM